MSYLRPTRHFPQKATYWAQAAQTGYGGETWAAPIVIDCRWEDMLEERLSVAYRSEGEAVESRSVVYTRQPLTRGAYVFLGVTSAGNPTTLEGAYVVRLSISTPSLRGNYMEHVAHL